MCTKINIITKLEKNLTAACTQHSQGSTGIHLRRVQIIICCGTAKFRVDQSFRGHCARKINGRFRGKCANKSCVIKKFSANIFSVLFLSTKRMINLLKMCQKLYRNMNILSSKFFFDKVIIFVQIIYYFISKKKTHMKFLDLLIIIKVISRHTHFCFWHTIIVALSCHKR